MSFCQIEGFICIICADNVKAMLTFYGREPLVNLIWEKLRVGNVLLAAPRRFGKTSVMYNLIDNPRWNYKLIHADLEPMIEPAELITQMVVQLAKDDQLSQVAHNLSYFP